MQFSKSEQEIVIQREKEALAKAKIILGCPELPFQPFQSAQQAFHIRYPGYEGREWLNLKDLLTMPSGSRLPYFRKLEEICRCAFPLVNQNKDLRKAVAFGIEYFRLVVEIIVSEQLSGHKPAA